MVYINTNRLDLTWLVGMFLLIRQPVNPRTRQQPQPEASIQEPEEPEEILGSDDEEQEDPHDYCKGDQNLNNLILVINHIETLDKSICMVCSK